MFPAFDSIAGLRHGFSTRQDGNLRIPTKETDTKANRERYLRSINLNPMRVVSANLIHGTYVHIAQEEDAGTIIPDCDGLATNVPGLAISITGADCFPLYAVDPVERVIGMAHAGWRGIVTGVVSELISHLQELGSNPEQILIGIGPGIRVCHFEINEDVFSMFQGYGEFVVERQERVYVNLPSIIKQELHKVGIQSDHVYDSELCTYEMPDTYFSRRRDQQGPLQAMIAYLSLTDLGEK